LITGLAEQAMSFWPNKGAADPRPPCGSGYDRLKAVMPYKPIVPAGAPAELPLDAKTEDASRPIRTDTAMYPTQG
jgi:cholesterol oxidase